VAAAHVGGPGEEGQVDVDDDLGGVIGEVGAVGGVQGGAEQVDEGIGPAGADGVAGLAGGVDLVAPGRVAGADPPCAVGSASGAVSVAPWWASSG
jgi:hypothetical protein